MVRGGGSGNRKGAPPSAGDPRLRALNEPRPVRVRTDARGLPAAVALPDSRRRGYHAVEVVRESWRIDDEWWRETPVSRMYYELRLEGDRIVTVYHDLTGGGWWLQRY
ncbi:MAG TPA: hypothetical protein VE173_14670 [Longimicrobiales bacterium]|nr:hypothetical protein [Longimicrobiales bacterium]